MITDISSVGQVPLRERRLTCEGRREMRREWLIVLLIVILLVPVGCGPTAQAVTGDGNLSDSTTYTIQINEQAQENQPPKAVISGPTSGLVRKTLKFNGADSSDPDGRVVSYTWDFGDGTTGSGKNVTHVYKTAGTYKVTLTVTDDGKRTDQVVAQTRASSSTSKTYTVQSGDTLMEISRKLFNGDPQYWDDIADLNDIKAPYTIHPGQELEVPER